ncbi:hypothetical protein AVEN_171887-1, partial [Araneus ventricosus]
MPIDTADIPWNRVSNLRLFSPEAETLRRSVCDSSFKQKCGRRCKLNIESLSVVGNGAGGWEK